MKRWHGAWIGLAVLVVGALLPWAELDLDKVSKGQEGFGAMAAMMLKTFAGKLVATAWNGHASIGTARIPAWTVLVTATLAASLATLRARGMLVLPRAASPVLAFAGLAVAVTFGVQAHESGRLLAGYWTTVAGAIVLVVSVLRDPAVQPA